MTPQVIIVTLNYALSMLHTDIPLLSHMNYVPFPGKATLSAYDFRKEKKHFIICLSWLVSCHAYDNNCFLPVQYPKQHLCHLCTWLPFQRENKALKENKLGFLPSPDFICSILAALPKLQNALAENAASWNCFAHNKPNWSWRRVGGKEEGKLTILYSFEKYAVSGS